MCVCMYVCIFIKLHITAQSGPVISTHSMLLHVTHLGVTYRKHIVGWKCACTQLRLLSPLRPLTAGTVKLVCRNK